MPQIEFTMPAAEGEVYAPGCLDGYVDRTITVKLAVGGSVKGTLKSYRVAENRQSMRVVVDLPDEAASIIVPPQSGYSIGFNA